VNIEKNPFGGSLDYDVNEHYRINTHDDAAITFLKAIMRRPVHRLRQVYAAPCKEHTVHG